MPLPITSTSHRQWRLATDFSTKLQECPRARVRDSWSIYTFVRPWTVLDIKCSKPSLEPKSAWLSLLWSWTCCRIPPPDSTTPMEVVTRCQECAAMRSECDAVGMLDMIGRITCMLNDLRFRRVTSSFLPGTLCFIAVWTSSVLCAVTCWSLNPFCLYASFAPCLSPGLFLRTFHQSITATGISILAFNGISMPILEGGLWG